MSSLEKISNINELRTRKGTSGVIVEVLGYTTPGDDGGGSFHWDNLSVENDNGGTVITVAGVSIGRWKRILSGNILNVLWFGAKNDYSEFSTTDNTSAINATISAATVLRDANWNPTVPSTVSIYFPYGSGFRITNTISVPSSISVIMDGSIVFDNALNNVPALIIGDDTLSQRQKYVIDVTNKNGTIWPIEDGNANFDESSTGVKLINLYHCDITIRRSSNFSVGVVCFGQNGVGFVYNELHIGVLANNKVELQLSGMNGGWCNENNFFGGRFAEFSNTNNAGKSRYGVLITSSDGTYIGHNNNNFYKPSFELGGTQALPGIALPILIKHGSQNAFYNCRNEGNVSSGNTVIMRTMNNASQNNLETGLGTVGVIEDLGNFPSSTLSMRGRLLQDRNYINVYSSGDVVKKACQYNATETFIADELFFLSSLDANTYEHISAITINSDSLQLSAARGVGVRIDTTVSKRFVLKRATLAGFPGRPGVRCFDASGNILYDEEVPYVKGYPSLAPAASSSFGGHYSMGSDNTNNFYFSVTEDVAYIDVFIRGGTNSLQLRGFQVQAIDYNAGIINQKNKRGLFALQAPTTGTWSLGDIIWNNNPSSNSIVLWQNILAGSPGTWKPFVNSENLQGVMNAGNSTTKALDITYDPAAFGMRHIISPEGAFYINNADDATGAIKITLPFGPTPGNATMIVARILLSNQDTTGSSTTVTMSGVLNASTGPVWLYTSASVIGRNVFDSFVRFAYDGTNACFLIGDITTDTWRYPKVEITDLHVSHAGSDEDWDQGWTTSLVTDLTGFSGINTPPTMVVNEYLLHSNTDSTISGIKTFSNPIIGTAGLVLQSGTLGIGTLVVPTTANVHSRHTTLPQYKSSYDVGNYCEIQTSSSGATNFTLVGTNPSFSFNKSVSISGGIALPIGAQKTADYTALVSDYTIRGFTASGDVTITLPTTNIPTGQIYVVKKVAAANSLIIQPEGGVTIDGAPNVTLTAIWDFRRFQFDGTNYIIV